VPLLISKHNVQETPVCFALPVPWTLRSSKPTESMSSTGERLWCGTCLSDINRCTIRKSHKRSKNDWTSPRFSQSTRSRVSRIGTYSCQTPFPEVYTRRSAASILHTADELIPGTFPVVKKLVSFESYIRGSSWLHNRESVTTWPSLLHIHLNPTVDYRGNK
jgi:hypothetical protein